MPCPKPRTLDLSSSLRRIKLIPAISQQADAYIFWLSIRYQESREVRPLGTSWNVEGPVGARSASQ